jgi:hypothetical protein
LPYKAENRALDDAPTVQSGKARCRRWRARRARPRFLSAHDQINNLFHLRRDHTTTDEHRGVKMETYRIWAEVARIRLTAAEELTVPSKSRGQALPACGLDHRGAFFSDHDRGVRLAHISPR